MGIKNSLSKIAKSIQATMFYQHQALNYLKNAGYTGLLVEPKDIKRIKDMNSKSAGNESKYYSLVNQMANSIKDAPKAYRRGVAIMQYADVSSESVRQRLASVFFEKAISLG